MTKKHIDPVFKLQLRELFIIVLGWVVLVRFFILFDFLGLSADFAALKQARVFSVLRYNLLIATTASIIVGLLTGIFELWVFPRMFRNRSAGRQFLAKFLVYVIAMDVATIVVLFVYEFVGKELTYFATILEISRQMFTYTYLYIFVMGFLISTVIFVMRFLRNKIGLGLFLPIVAGHYYFPKQEERIFLFIDLKSSTNIAETLQHIQYSRLLQDCYRDLSILVIRNHGQIYQFVGDEAVITWKIKPKTDFRSPIRLFLQYKKLLASKKIYYMKNYGHLPSFKGSVNSGMVSAAEVGGDIKSEIAFHGDVLNTAFRIMEQCKVHKHDFLISKNIKEKIEPCDDEFIVNEKGMIKLRGKLEPLEVFSVDDVDANKT
jgi:adenylate cyclase